MKTAEELMREVYTWGGPPGMQVRIYALFLEAQRESAAEMRERCAALVIESEPANTRDLEHHFAIRSLPLPGDVPSSVGFGHEDV